MNYLLEALIKKLEGEIAMAKANIEVYINNPAGIGEHPDIAEAVESELLKIANAQDIIDMVDRHFTTEEQISLFS